MMNLESFLIHQLDNSKTMNKYYIVPNSLIGIAWVSESSTKQYSYPEGVFPKGSVVMEIDALMEGSGKLYNNSDFPLISDQFKKEIEQEGFTELTFTPVDFLFIGLNLEDNNPNHGLTKDDFWQLNIAPEGEHFFKWKTRLVVSEVALSFLKAKNAFREFDEGISLGQEYSLVTNKFLIEGNFEGFFLEKWPKIYAEIEEKRKIHAALRKSMRNK